MTAIPELVARLREILRHDEVPLEQVRAFQDALWESPDTDDDEVRWDLLVGLGTDFEYYVPSPDLRRELPSYFGDERLVEESRSTLEKLEKAEEGLRET